LRPKIQGHFIFLGGQSVQRCFGPNLRMYTGSCQTKAPNETPTHYTVYFLQNFHNSKLRQNRNCGSSAQKVTPPGIHRFVPQAVQDSEARGISETTSDSPALFCL